MVSKFVEEGLSFCALLSLLLDTDLLILEHRFADKVRMVTLTLTCRVVEARGGVVARKKGERFEGIFFQNI